jgi:hypothetical protein
VVGRPLSDEIYDILRESAERPDSWRFDVVYVIDA